MPETARLVRLDEADARNPALVGAKACRLAQARSRGLPVLDGLVVAAGVSEPVVGAARAVWDRTGNSGAARSSVFNRPPPALLSELAEAGRRLGDRLVVRSSSRAEEQGFWAGAFSSYRGIRPEELTRAVIGCWASIFNPPTLKRAETMGVSPSGVGMAVLVQPEIRPACGGVATLGDDGTVTVVGARGHPAGLRSGREVGQIATVTSDNLVRTDSSLSTRLLRRVADLSRTTARKIDCRHIEWLADRTGELYLVQAQPKVDTGVHRFPDPPTDPAHSAEPWMADVVRMMIRYPGPVGEKLVWPWAVGLDSLRPASTGPTRRPVATLVEEVQRGAVFLKAQRRGGAVSSGDVERVWSSLRAGDPSPLRELISRCSPVDSQVAARFLRDLRQLGHALVTAGVIPHPGWVWHLNPDRLHQPLGGGTPMRRIGVTGRDVWMYGVVASRGESITGIPAAGGLGVGRLRHIGDADDAARFSPREVIAAPLPVGNIAPLLWNAAGLITVGGSPGAHLFEVAEWLAVPALCGVDLSGWTGREGRGPTGEERPIVAVDGARGRAAVLPHRP